MARLPPHWSEKRAAGVLGDSGLGTPCSSTSLLFSLPALHAGLMDAPAAACLAPRPLPQVGLPLGLSTPTHAHTGLGANTRTVKQLHAACSDCCSAEVSWRSQRQSAARPPPASGPSLACSSGRLAADTHLLLSSTCACMHLNMQVALLAAGFDPGLPWPCQHPMQRSSQCCAAAGC